MQYNYICVLTRLLGCIIQIFCAHVYMGGKCILPVAQLHIVSFTSDGRSRNLPLVLHKLNERWFYFECVKFLIEVVVGNHCIIHIDIECFALDQVIDAKCALHLGPIK